MGVGHYENFPVASLMLPAHLRPAVQAIYRFARAADDIADEGILTDAQRLDRLDALSQQLNAIAAGQPNDWPELAAAIQVHALPLGPFRDLLSAFKQDVTVRSYPSFDVLFDYCRRSANPVGRLLLTLYRRTDASCCAWSDAICTALQLINFWQDVPIDFAKGRVYIPQSELHRCGVTAEDIGARRADDRWRALMRTLTAHAGAMLSSGAPLARALGGRIGLELRLVIQGGLRILERIDAANGDVFTRRPVLRSADWLVVGARALVM
jgi:squalene synthase HpnC